MTAPVQSKPRIRITADGWIVRQGVDILNTAYPATAVVQFTTGDEATGPRTIAWWRQLWVNKPWCFDGLTHFRIIDIGEAA